MTEPVASPCIKVCRLDADGQWCTGCGRSLSEIAGWADAEDGERRAIISRAQRRLDTNRADVER
ncbi:DUF1289 domain-containing protein [Qipengyuania sp. NPDC077563]|uniref:DUF1289 domain-containing protein n=1 Tax=Qipengyuania sp. NPDC077563 TaxID=3364497 RepID=UPI00384C4690